MNTITVRRHSEAATLPEFVFPMAVGYDIFCSESKLIEKGKKDFVETDISIMVPHGCYGHIANKPSLQSVGISVEGPIFWPGTYNYVKIIMQNNGHFELPLQVGDKIATLVILPMDPPVIVSFDEEDREVVEINRATSPQYEVSQVKKFKLNLNTKYLPKLVGEKSFLQNHVKFVLVKITVSFHNF